MVVRQAIETHGASAETAPVRITRDDLSAALTEIRRMEGFEEP